MDFRARMEQGGVLWDGGMGSALIARGLEPGAPPERWNIDRPGEIGAVHDAYIEAGADVLTTNTFGATPSRLKGFDLCDRLADINNSAVDIARDSISRAGREACVFIAFSVGPTGKMLPPVGTAEEAEIEDEFAAQIGSLDRDVDLFIGETFFDIREAELFLRAFRSARSDREDAVGVTLTFNRTPRGFFTIMGDPAGESIRRVCDAGADFSGANCTLVSPDMVDLAGLLLKDRTRPLLCQPNAGDPSVENGVPVYGQRAEEFAADAERMCKMGINAVGGCCGTDYRFIRETAGLIKSGRKQA